MSIDLIYQLIRPFLFRLPPETAHALTLSLLRAMPAFLIPKVIPQKEIKAMGLTFPHPVGLAAGLDKSGEYLAALAKCGFSFIELGTVTPRAQPGNPKPRLFRLEKQKALINRMGFNNPGVDALLTYVKAADYHGILGINIGKNKETPLSKAANDYLYCFEKVYWDADYVTVNISSPNTPDLRVLQQGTYLSDLLKQLVMLREKLAQKHQKWVPLALKISPDESIDTLKEIANQVLCHKIEAIIATNTMATEQGGLSGAPLLSQSTDCLYQVKQWVGDAVTLIGAGGIMSGADGLDKLKKGATLLQVYTGLIYQGPGLIKALLD